MNRLFAALEYYRRNVRLSRPDCGEDLRTPDSIRQMGIGIPFA